MRAGDDVDAGRGLRAADGPVILALLAATIESPRERLGFAIALVFLVGALLFARFLVGRP